MSRLPGSVSVLADPEGFWRFQGLTLIAGVDEVGRGPLAGPVVAAAVITTLYSVPPFRTKRLGIWGGSYGGYLTALDREGPLLLFANPVEKAPPKAKDAGVPFRLVVREGREHGWPGIEKDLELFADWFDNHLQKGKPKP